MTILLDTTVLIDTLRNLHGRRTLLAGFVEQGHILATTAINVGEVYSGMRPDEAARTGAFLGELEVLPITSQIAHHAGTLLYSFARRVKTLTLPICL